MNSILDDSFGDSSDASDPGQELPEGMAEEVRIPLSALKGRGSATQIAHRFSKDQRDPFYDGWDTEADLDDASLPLQTTVTLQDVKSVITRNESPDIPFDRSINPYRGCEHGCIYCFARPTHSYLNLSPGLDFETQIFAKRNIVEVLRREISARSYTPGHIAIGTATDCYQPAERDLRLTRSVIELLGEANHPFGLVSKSSAMERDMDLLVPLAAKQLAAVYITITTLDPKLARILEPRAAAPHRRLRTIKTLSEQGIPVGVSVAPQIPFINDDMEKVLEAAWEAGARSAFYTVIRLPWEVAPLFREWLQVHYPQRADRVMARIQEMRGGKDYDADFSTRMKGDGLWAQLLAQRFEKACHRLGFNRERTMLDASRFRPPSPSGQSTLF